MNLLLYISDFIVPVTIFGIVTYGICNKANVYDDFIKGAKTGFFTVIKNYADFDWAYGGSRYIEGVWFF